MEKYEQEIDEKMLYLDLLTNDLSTTTIGKAKKRSLELMRN